MPLQTQGFQLSALPQPLQVPGNLGVVKPPLDPQEILALAQQHLSALNQAQQARVQNEQVDMAQRAQASSLASQAQQRSLSAAAGEREATIFPETLSGAQLQNQGRAQTISQLGESFNTAAPVRSLAAAEAARNESLIGPDGETSDYRPAPDGNGFIVTKTQTKNGIPVGKSVSRVALPPGYTPASQVALDKLSKATVYEIGTDNPREVRSNGRGDYIDPETRQPLDFSRYTLTAPNKAKTAADVASAKNIVEISASLPKARSSLNNAVADNEVLQNKIKQAIALSTEANTGLSGKLYANFAGDSKQLRNLVTSIKANNTISALKQIRGDSKTGGALGNVSNRDLAVLESKIALLDPDGDAEYLKAGLQEISDYFNKSLERTNKALELDEATVKDGVIKPSAQSSPREITPEERATLEKLLIEHPDSPSAPQARLLLGK